MKVILIISGIMFILAIIINIIAVILEHNANKNKSDIMKNKENNNN